MALVKTQTVDIAINDDRAHLGIDQPGIIHVQVQGDAQALCGRAPQADDIPQGRGDFFAPERLCGGCEEHIRQGRVRWLSRTHYNWQEPGEYYQHQHAMVYAFDPNDHDLVLVYTSASHDEEGGHHQAGEWQVEYFHTRLQEGVAVFFDLASAVDALMRHLEGKIQRLVQAEVTVTNIHTESLQPLSARSSAPARGIRIGQGL